MADVFLTAERPRPTWLREHPRAWVAAVLTVCVGAFLGQLDASVVALTYRSIGHQFDAGLERVQWVSLSYLAVLAVLLGPIGRLSDRIGRKRVYLWGFTLFGAASVACAAAPSLLILVVLRTVQGAGAAMLQANSVALVTTSAPPHRLRWALGVQAAAQAVGLALGPTVGGLIVQSLGWRWVFAVNAPIAVLAVLAARLTLPRTRLYQRPDHNATDTRSRRSLLTTGTVVRGLLGAFGAYLVLFGPIVLVPSLLQEAGVGPARTGLVVAALPAGFALAAVGAERLLPRRWDETRRSRLGLGLAMAGLVLGVAAGSTPGRWIVVLALVGIGLGIYTPANNAQVMASVPREAAGFLGGLVSTARALGTAAGTALVAGTLIVAGSGILSSAMLALVTLLAFATTAVSGRPRTPRFLR